MTQMYMHRQIMMSQNYPLEYKISCGSITIPKNSIRNRSRKFYIQLFYPINLHILVESPASLCDIRLLSVFMCPQIKRPKPCLHYTNEDLSLLHMTQHQKCLDLGKCRSFLALLAMVLTKIFQNTITAFH